MAKLQTDCGHGLIDTNEHAYLQTEDDEIFCDERCLVYHYGKYHEKNDIWGIDWRVIVDLGEGEKVMSEKRFMKKLGVVVHG